MNYQNVVNKNRNLSRILILFGVFVMLASFVFVAQSPVTATESSSTSRVEVYRLYNSYTGEHFFTTDASEKDDIIKAGWTDEGTGWYAPSSSETEVYRMYNPYARGGEHHFTVNRTECETLKSEGWTEEGVGWYSADEGEEGSTAVYCQYNPNQFSCNHNYTLDTTERDNLLSLGWVNENVVWHGYTNNTASKTEIDFTKATVDTSNKTYSGNQIKPSVTIEGMIAGTDYVVTYGENTNAGEGTIKVDGTGNYTGSKTYTFKIEQADPVYSPSGLIGYLGRELSTVTLPDPKDTETPASSVVWTNGSTVMENQGKMTFSVTFTPEDTTNYKTVSDLQVEVEVMTVSNKGFWMGTKNAGTEYADEQYFESNDLNYHSADEIIADMKALHGDSASEAYKTAKAKWDKYYEDDQVRLYATYAGGENEGSFDTESDDHNEGETSELNKYVEFRILQVGEHDSDGSAVTFMATHLLPTAYQMNSTETNVGGWGDSLLQKAMNESEGTIYQKFSSDFKNQVKAVSKTYGTGNETVETNSEFYKFWILSDSELGGAGYSISEGSQYAWCADQGIKFSAATNSVLENWKTRAGATPGSAYHTSTVWWLRSPSAYDNGYFVFVYQGGNLYNNFTSANYAWGLPPAFAF